MRFSQLSGFIFLALLFFSCDKDSIDEGNEAPKVRVFLMDGPADVEEVNINIVDVQINSQGGENGWQSLSSVNTGVYDLLELTGGNEVLLGDAEIPEGRLEQIRLILGDGNSIKIDGQTQELNTPSAQESGLKVQIKQDLEAGITYKLLLDFDAGQSIVEAGNSGMFQLKPVIRANLEALTGSIQGQVLPDTIQTLVTATNDTETFSSYTNETGYFLLRGVPEGTYRLTFTPEEDSDFSEITLLGIVVAINQSTDLGAVELLQ